MKQVQNVCRTHFLERIIHGAFKCAGHDGLRRFAYKKVFHACLRSEWYLQSEAAAATPSRTTFPLTNIL